MPKFIKLCLPWESLSKGTGRKSKAFLVMMAYLWTTLFCKGAFIADAIEDCNKDLSILSAVWLVMLFCSNFLLAKALFQLKFICLLSFAFGVFIVDCFIDKFGICLFNRFK